MLVELGNHACALPSIDDQPKVTRIHIPEADADGLGGYTYKPGALSVGEFRRHRQEAFDFRGGITSLPDHEALLAITAAWPSQARGKPAWIGVAPHPDLTPDGQAEDIESFLREFYELPDSASRPLEDELQARYWTPAGPPGVGFPAGPPDITNLFTNNGRVIANVNDGGGQVGSTGQATASSATSLTNTGAAWTTNQWAGYRVYATVSATVMVWGNVISNTATVLTVDQWYAAATPGGAAGSTPSATATYLIADGGVVSAWFVALTTTNITPAAADTALSGEYGTASGGFLRKIAPYAQTSGVATRSITLTPVYTGNGSDTYPSTFYAIGVGVSMVRPFPAGTMKFETSLNASATVNASGDQLTVTETISGS